MRPGYVRMVVMEHRRIKIGKRYIECLVLALSGKNLIVLRGSKGYLMCGYLNLRTAIRCHDAAIKVVGISTVEETLHAKVTAATPAAKKLGVFKGQAVKEALALIA
jgi:uncharacterized protein YunC (DUF1805 family)